MKCPLCKQQIPDDSVFCECCGGRVPRCPTCGRVITAKMNFCEVDGTRIPDEINVLFAVREEKTALLHAEQCPQKNMTAPAHFVPAPTAAYDEEMTVRARPAPVSAYDEEGTVRARPAPVSAYDEEMTVRARPAPVGDRKTPAPPVYSNQNVGRQYDQEYTVRARPAPGGYQGSSRESYGSAASAGQKQEGSNKGLVILLVALLATVLLLGAIVLIFMFGGSGSDDDEEKSSSRRGTEEASEMVETESNADTTVPAQTTAPTEPVVTYTYRYEIIQGDLTWEQARQECERRGGYLATIGSWEEFSQITAMAKQTDLRYLWVGAKLPYSGAKWSEVGWIDGTPWTYENWYPGEPSGQDHDGVAENCLCIWTVEDDIWTFNDERNNLVGDFPNTSGRVGFVCEYKDVDRS